MANKRMLVVAAVLVIGGMVLSAGATPIAVPNFSFETPDLPEGGAYTSSPPDWTASYDDTVFSQWTGGIMESQRLGYFPNWGSGPEDGDQYAYFNYGSRFSSEAVTTILGGTDYTLTVALGNTGDSFRVPGGYELALMVGDDVVASYTLNDAYTAIAAHTFVDYSVTLNAAAVAAQSLAGQDLTIRLTCLGDSDHRRGYIDNVRLDATAVPEPVSAILLAMGGVGMLWRRARRRRR